MKKYYVIKTTKRGIEYKKYKCIEGWSKTSDGCWRFSKAGADKIVKRLNKAYDYEGQSYPKRIHFSAIEIIAQNNIQPH